MPNSLWEKFGALTLDVPAAGITDTLASFDPGRDVLLGLFKQAIESELGAAFDVAKVGSQLASASIVQTTLPFPPSNQIMRELKAAAFPLLAVYRDGNGQLDWRTLTYRKLVQPWRVDFVLGPLPVADIRKLYDLLPAVTKVIDLTIERRMHPDYDGGALQFFDDVGGKFSEVKATGVGYGPARFADQGDDSPVYYAASIQLETTELEAFRDGSSTNLDGVSFTFGVGDDSQILPELIEADTSSTPPDLLP
jgi:hypothetical protein